MELESDLRMAITSVKGVVCDSNLIHFWPNSANSFSRCPLSMCAQKIFWCLYTVLALNMVNKPSGLDRTMNNSSPIHTLLQDHEREGCKLIGCCSNAYSSINTCEPRYYGTHVNFLFISKLHYCGADYTYFIDSDSQNISGAC